MHPDKSFLSFSEFIILSNTNQQALGQPFGLNYNTRNPLWLRITLYQLKALHQFSIN